MLYMLPFVINDGGRTRIQIHLLGIRNEAVDVFIAAFEKLHMSDERDGTSWKVERKVHK